MILTAHTAPLDMKFGVGADSNLYLGMHGRWHSNLHIVRAGFFLSKAYGLSVTLIGIQSMYVLLRLVSIINSLRLSRSQDHIRPLASGLQRHRSLHAPASLTLSQMWMPQHVNQVSFLPFGELFI